MLLQGLLVLHATLLIFGNIFRSQASDHLKDAQPGDVVIRPKRGNNSRLNITFKFLGGVVCNIGTCIV